MIQAITRLLTSNRARTSIDRDAPSHDVPRIKTEFVFGAE